MSELQQAANDAIGVLADVSESLQVVKEFVDNNGDDDLAKAAKQATDAVTLLRLKLWNRSTEGKFRNG